MTDFVWSVPATVVRVIDGDTVVVNADLGWHVHIETAVRVDGINAPEKNTDAGKAAKAYAETVLSLGLPITIMSKKQLGSFEKYGRVLADLYIGSASFAQTMLHASHAVPWDGSGARPLL